MKKFDIHDGKGVAVELQWRPANAHEPEHTHEFVELVYTVKGSFTHYINGKPYHVSRGDMLFINYGETHSFDVGDEHSCFYNFCVKPEFMSENIISSETINDIFLIFLPEGTDALQSRGTSCVRFIGEERLEIERISKKMYDELDCDTGEIPCQSLVLNAYMRLIFAKLIRALLRDAGAERPNILTDEVLKYIDANFTSPVSSVTLANHCFYNPAYLGRVFKTVYGKSMNEYIREKRMNYAMEMLTSTSLSVEEICERVGYRSRAQFYKSFKEFFGKTPGEFRK